MRVAAEQLQLATEFRNLWKGLLPSFEVPGDDQFLLWADVHSPELVTHGINRAARKARKMAEASTPMTMNDAARYASSVMNNESKGLRRFESGITPSSKNKATSILAVLQEDDNIGNRA
jgi:hypothetical protein